MRDPYETCPVYENEKVLLRLTEAADAGDLLAVYSDEKAVPFFNGDNCNGDDFHYTTMERMQGAVAFWQQAYTEKWFVRWTIVDKASGRAVGTIELFNRRAQDYFNECGLLRLDLRSDYEREDWISGILSLIVPDAFTMFGCHMAATKVWPYAAERKKAVEKAGFALSEEVLIGGDDGKTYTDYYVRLL